MHPEHRFFQKITPLGPFLFILHVASGNGQDPAPSFPWHLAPAELGVMPLPIVMGGHDGQAMRLRRLRKRTDFCFKPDSGVCGSSKGVHPLQNMVANNRPKIEFFSEAQKKCTAGFVKVCLR